MDYESICCTCFRKKATLSIEFHELSKKITTGNEGDGGGGSANEHQISLIDCLEYCTQYGYRNDLTLFICNDCCMALQVTYNFIRIAKKSQQILYRNNNNNSSSSSNNKINNDKNATSAPDSVKSHLNRRLAHYKCKLCGEKLETKKILKEHHKKHSELRYECEICKLVTTSRQGLQKHYKTEHNTDATELQLKSKGLPNGQVDGQSVAPEKQEKPKEPPASVAVVPDAPKVESKPISQEEKKKNKVELIESIILSAPKATPAPATIKATSDPNANGQSYEVDMGQTMSSERLPVMIAYINEAGQEETLVIANNNNNNDINNGNNQIVHGTTNLLQLDGDGNGNVNINGSYIYVNELGQMVAIENGPQHLNQTQVQVQVQSQSQQQPNLPIQEQQQQQQQPQQQAVIANNIESEEEQATAAKVVAIADSTKKSIHCKICEQTFVSQDDLKQHMLTHQEIPHFYCDHCAFYTFYKIDITQHYRTKHNVTPTTKQLQARNKSQNIRRIIFKCHICSHIVFSKEDLGSHYTVKHNIAHRDVQAMLFTNLVDDKPASVQIQKPLEEALDIELDPDLMPSIIEKPMANGYGETNNDNILFDQYIELVDNNSVDFPGKETLMTSDEENDENSAPIVCQMCKESFPSNYHLENHLFLHRGMSPYRCEVCPSRFNMKKLLRRHYEEAHALTPRRIMLQPKDDKVEDKTLEVLPLEAHDPPMLMCGKCRFETQQPNEMNIHFKTVHSDSNSLDNFMIQKQPFVCPRCIRAFPTVENLVRHLGRSHSIASHISEVPQEELTSHLNGQIVTNGVN